MSLRPSKAQLQEALLNIDTTTTVWQRLSEYLDLLHAETAFNGLIFDTTPGATKGRAAMIEEIQSIPAQIKEIRRKTNS